MTRACAAVILAAAACGGPAARPPSPPSPPRAAAPPAGEREAPAPDLRKALPRGDYAVGGINCPGSLGLHLLEVQRTSLFQPYRVLVAARQAHGEWTISDVSFYGTPRTMTWRGCREIAGRTVAWAAWSSTVGEHPGGGYEVYADDGSGMRLVAFGGWTTTAHVQVGPYLSPGGAEVGVLVEDERGRRGWTWHELEHPVHAPPIPEL